MQKALPFADRSFDLVVGQFGLMFVPDKDTAIGRRIAFFAEGGTYLFNVWDAIEQNEIARIAHRNDHLFFRSRSADVLLHAIWLS